MRLLSEYYEVSLNQIQLTEAVNSAPGSPIMLRGIIIQRADAKNRNGRIYPKDVLKREIDKYIENMVDMNRALGELDHCFVENNFDVLTESGWKSFNDVIEGENVLSYNIKNGALEYKPVLKKIESTYSGDSYSIKARNINTQVTENHKFILEDRYGNKEFHTIKEIFENRVKYNKSKIIKIQEDNSNIDELSEIYVDDDMQIEKLHHEGNIYCLEVKDNNSFYVRQNDKCFITGNSAESVVNLKNVSHNIKSIYWKGNDVVADLEILDAPEFPAGRIAAGLLRRKIPVGISSRGMGSVDEAKDGTVTVNDDFNLLTFDLVSFESTQGANMYLQEGKTISNDKNSKIDSILKELICINAGYCPCD